MSNKVYIFLKSIYALRNKLFFRNLFRFFFNPILSSKRSFLKYKYIKDFEYIKINSETGFGKISIESIPTLFKSFDRLVSLASKRIKNLDINYIERTKGVKSFFPQLLRDEDLLNPDFQFILEAALDPNLLSGIARYTGWIPQINFINLLYGRDNSQKNYLTTQFPHRDGGDSNHFHVFIYLKDIKSEDGATKILSKKFLNFYPNNYEVKSSINVPEAVKNKFQALEGKKGDIFLFDASNCPHYGGRSTRGGERILLQFHYVRFAPYSKSHKNEPYRNLDITKNKLISNLVKKQICKWEIQHLSIN